VKHKRKRRSMDEIKIPEYFFTFEKIGKLSLSLLMIIK
jgi:hypothetical protein